MLTARDRGVKVTRELAMRAKSYGIKPFSTYNLVAQVNEVLSGDEAGGAG
jgi:DNA-binding response OmpR family regulator